MRLIKLKVKNIASLKGEHLIEFDAITEVSSLFAITGETGSGKSSILNAIAMALYGKVYKSSVTQADIVTLGEREGQIQLIFSIKNEYFLADWKGRIRRPNGELLKQPKLERVIQKIETPDFESERSVEAYIADELLNLNFDQFCKCIILNQGEFAKFLSSSFTDRKAILEKLYPGSEIENITKALKLELDQANSRINIIKTQLDTLHTAPEEGEVLTLKKSELTEQVKLKTEWQKRYANLSKLFEELQIYYSAYQENKARQNRLAEEIKEITHLFNQSMVETEKKQKALEEINAHAEKVTPLLQELIKKEEQHKIIKEQTASFEEKLQKILDQKKEADEQFIKVESQKNEWAIAHEKTLRSFHFSPNSLLTHKKQLENFVDNIEQIEKQEIEKKNLSIKIYEMEARGKELRQHIEEVEKNITNSPEEVKTKTSNLKELRIKLQERMSLRQLQEKTKEQSLNKTRELEKELTDNQFQVESIRKELSDNGPLLKSLEVSLSLYEYQINLKKCLSHGKEQNLKDCPICERELSEQFWNNISLNFNEENIEEISNKFERLVASNTELKNKEIFLLSQQDKLKLELQKLTEEIEQLDAGLKTEIPDIKKIDKEIEEAETELIQLEHHNKELIRLNGEIKQIRVQYIQLKEGLTKLEKEMEPLIKENFAFIREVKDIYPQLENKIIELKADLRSLVQLTQEIKQGEALEQRLVHIKEITRNAQVNITELQEKIENNKEILTELQEELSTKLKGKSAQEKLSLLQESLKTASGELQSAQQIQKGHEQSLSLRRGNFSSIKQLLEDYELKFTQTLVGIRNMGEESTPLLFEKVENFELKLKDISLTLNDSQEVILASKAFIEEILSEVDESLKDFNNELGVIKEKISQWEKTQDKLKLLRLEFEEASAKVERFKRLSTILGTDELRTFALSLVEENLILQTNEELSHLCESRYEIIHQSRRGITPEFYILDKFREGGIRKVSTLSGGETFMVSLAMALALAEMTRGQAEIDTLFIDEGFGTLDQESLEDVLEMLNQIQNRGLMIGIISHIKTLTHALAVNLVLNKGQDGTSKLSIQFN